MNTETSKNLFSGVSFFSAFPEAELERLQQVSAIRKLKKNTNLIVEGDESHAAYVLLSGTASAFTSGDDGNEFIVNSFHAGDFFGELGVLDQSPRTASVVTTSDCECLVIPRAELMRAIESEPRVASAIISTLVSRIRDMTEDVSCLALMDVYSRIVRVLKSESKPNEDGIMQTGPMTHQELANRVGASREMISKILKDLKKGGYIDTSDKKIAIAKPLPDRW